MAEKIDKSERLFNLTCALLVTKRGLTKGEIFQTVQGYKENFKPGDQTAMDRLFERDKDDLAESGVLVQGAPPASEDKNNQEFRYRIPNETFIWPKDAKLTARQVSLLNLAAQVWAKASLSHEVELALTRLRALGDIPEDSGILGIAPSITTQDRNFMPLSLAIETGQIVEFQYRKPGANKPEKRQVQPWRLQNVSGQWLLVSLDQGKQEVRNFLLKRIVSKITPTGEVFEKPTQAQITEAVVDLGQLVERQVASLRIKPDTVAWNYFEMDLPRAETDNVHHLNYMDEGILAEKLRSFGTDIEVIRPATLASAIRSGLEKVVNDHA